MPNPGQVNNSSGANGYTLPGGAESAYGSVKRLTQQTKAFPIATPGANAPKQATRASQQQEAPLAHPADAVPAQAVSPAAQYAALWAAVAATPGASPLVQQIAQEAQSGV